MQQFTGVEYLKIDIANNFGLDKNTWDERLAWFEENKTKLNALLNQAEEPALFFAGVQAYNDVLAGKPIGYTISLDATSSGLQLLAVLTGDRKAAEICNVVNYKNKRMDAYTAVYEAMLRIVGGESKVKRKDCKQAVMTSLYGSKAEPIKVFGMSLLRTFIRVMEEEAPMAWKLNQTFLDIWDSEALMNSWVLPDNFHVHVKVMDVVKERVNFLNEPFEVNRKVNQPTKEGRSLGANTIHSLDGMIVREMGRRCMYDPKQINNIRVILADGISEQDWTMCNNNINKKNVETLWKHYEESGFLSARILDYLNNETMHLVDRHIIRELVDSLPAKPFQVLSIHDCFRCLPHYGNDLRKQYTNLLYLIGRSDMANFIISQITGRKAFLKKLDPNMHQDILDTEYALS